MNRQQALDLWYTLNNLWLDSTGTTRDLAWALLQHWQAVHGFSDKEIQSGKV